MIEFNGKKYRIEVSSPTESACVLCELPLCIIGVTDCENEFGDDTYFKEIKY